MNKILCPICGEVQNYGMTESIKRFLVFDADGEPEGATEDIIIYQSNTKRCLCCGHKVKIVEEIERDVEEKSTAPKATFAEPTIYVRDDSWDGYCGY